MQWMVTTHLMPPTVIRSASTDAVVEQVARALEGDWSAEPLEAALADIHRQKSERGTSFGWTTYHPPGYRITFRVTAANPTEARDVAATRLVLPNGWSVDSAIDIRPARDPPLPP
jgi:hypothetical protein